MYIDSKINYIYSEQHYLLTLSPIPVEHLMNILTDENSLYYF